MLQDIAPGAMSTCGLSNVSNGAPEHLRGILNQTYAIMLERYGMASIITDPRDEKMTEIAKGKRDDIKDIVYAVMDDNEPNMNDLSKEMVDFLKTAKVLMGKSLYSDSWLEL
jgi:5-methyltetrahydrofolate corrinoid/iron sulfur protein methyltransferase